MSDATAGDKPAEEPASLPQRHVTINQLVGFNLNAYRRANELTQDEFGRHMGGWSAASVSAAERSWDGRRIRKFDADEIVQIADVLGVPVIALLLPPPDAGTVVDYVFEFGRRPPAGLSGLLGQLDSTFRLNETPAAVSYRERLIALGTKAAPEFPVGNAIISRAQQRADDILLKVRDSALHLTGDARARAEALERDAQERHRRAMGSLVESREELERRVDDLRQFEREYRVRLLAYLESQVRDLKAGAVDSGAFPAIGGPSGSGDRHDGGKA